MIHRYSYENITWLDVIHPTSEDVREIFTECDIPAEFADDLTSMTPRTETKSQKGSVKITLDFPIVKRTDIDRAHEIKFIATKKHLVTIRFEDITAVHSFTKQFEVLGLMKKTGSKAGGGHLLLTMLGHLYSSLDEKIDYLESKIQDIEENIFKNNEKEMLLAISGVSRRLVSFRHSLMAHEAALDDLAKANTIAFGKTFTGSTASIRLTYHHLSRRLVALSGTLEELRDTNNALLTTKQNEVMKTLTIMAFITFPLTLFTSLFGMNTTDTPLVGSENGFWYITGIMVVVSIGFFIYFKYKNWI